MGEAARPERAAPAKSGYEHAREASQKVAKGLAEQIKPDPTMFTDGPTSEPEEPPEFDPETDTEMREFMDALDEVIPPEAPSEPEPSPRERAGEVARITVTSAKDAVEDVAEAPAKLPKPDPRKLTQQNPCLGYPMNNNKLYCHISSKRIAELIQKAKGSICYAGPGIQKEPAKAMSEVVAAIGFDKVTVSLDFDERVLRMGYGDREAMEILRKAGIEINRARGFRSGLIIVDGEGYIFTPTPLYLEPESDSDFARNAMRLLPGQVAEALARLCPKTREEAAAQASDPETKKRLASLPDEVELLPITDDQLKQVDQRLKEAPPVPFDVVRQVRVYEPILQYAEITLFRAAIHRYRVKIPRVLQDLGISEELEGRLQTTFDLIQKDSSSNQSFKSLVKEVEEIRDCYTPSLGKGYGRVILKRRKPLFKEEIAEVRKEIENLKKEETSKLQTGMNESRQLIIDHYLQRVTENPPRRLRAQSNSEKPTKKDAREWLGQVLETEFPTAKTLTQGIEIEVRYKDVTFEDLKCEDFLNQVKKAFPELDWDRAHEEFMAAGETNSGDSKDGVLPPGND